MQLKISNVAIVYLSLSLFLLFIGVKRIPKNEVIFELLLILFITFVLNTLSINGLNNVAWYLVIFFILIPFILAVMSIMPLFVTMLGKINSLLFFLFLFGLSIFIVLWVLYFTQISKEKSNNILFSIGMFVSSMILLMIGIFYCASYIVSNVK